MILVPHILIGAAIGAKIRHFGWIIVLGLISHLILDRIPHWDYGNRAFKKFKKDKSFKFLVIFVFQVIVDVLIGLAIVFLIIWQKNMIRQLADLNDLQFIIVGIFASVLPDFLLSIASLSRTFSNKFQKITTKYIDFHKNMLHYPKHIFKPTLLGLGTEILISLIAILVLLL